MQPNNSEAVKGWVSSPFVTSDPEGLPKKRVLVVDYDINLTNLLKLSLEMTGLFIVRTENVPHAVIATAEEFLPDLIFLDVMMPGMDGGQLSTLLQSHPTLKSARIVFLTAAATKAEVHERGGTIGGLPFLAKPVTRQEILTCISQQLG